MRSFALGVKIRGKFKNKLTPEMYTKMAMQKSVPDVARILKEETGYGNILADIDTENIHRGYLEKLLAGSIMRDINSLRHFAGIDGSAFMQIFTASEEIENLKVFLRLLYSERTEQFRPSPVLSGKSEIDFSKFSSINSFGELLNEISGTEYAVPLKGFLEYPEHRNIFDMEIALDMYYNSLVFKKAKKTLGKQEFEVIREIYGSEMDLETVMLIIRAKRSFEFSKEQLYSYTRFRHAHLSDELVEQMVAANTEEEVFEILKTTKYRDVFKGDNTFPEKKIDEYLAKLHKKGYRKAEYSVEAVLCYVKLKDVELRNVVTIIEGIRYGLAAKDIENYLIGIDRQEGR